MIVRMKKASIVTQSKDADSALKELRACGVLHLEHQRLPKSHDITSIQEDAVLLQKAIDILSDKEFSRCFSCENQKSSTDWKTQALHIVDLKKRLDHLRTFSIRTAAEIEEWSLWGDFDPEYVQRLAEKNIYVTLYRLPAAELANIPQGLIVEKLFVAQGLVHCAVISQEPAKLQFKPVKFPKQGLKVMQMRLMEDERVMEVIASDICKLLIYRESYKKIRLSLLKELEFQEARFGMGTDKDLAYLVGYVPMDLKDKLLNCAKENQWGIMITDPSDDDSVPTLIRNPKWISIIEPVFKLIEVVPGYHELDISLWFLVFLSIFFGMLIGDAGYGAVFFLLTFFAQLKTGEKLQNKSIFVLFYLFSLCAVIWGLLSGTIFGQAWLPVSVKPLIPALRQDKNIQEVCFVIGALHLSIGHIWRFIRKLPSFESLADLGWVFILWGAFFLAKTLILGEELAGMARIFFITGPLLVVFFTSVKKNILKGVGAGLGNLLLNFVNSFTDLVSYIRLFAVGLATVAVADAFNQMAMGVGFNSFFSGLTTAMILFLGHALNIVLGPMAILVHGVRLNVLEFCNHVDVKWSGFSYRPLKQ